ncbi:MAG TPA: hypothetical protein DEQ32_11485 [Gammaproteobacteria bacterium]|nr:hypothetical protein [Gammaproteobacteria bacterium]
MPAKVGNQQRETGIKSDKKLSSSKTLNFYLLDFEGKIIAAKESRVIVKGDFSWKENPWNSIWLW